MRIAIVSDYFLDYVGGAQTSMQQQRLALLEAGHEVVMVSAVRGGSGRYHRTAEGLTIKPAFTLPGLRLPVIPNNDATRRRLRALFIHERIDAVHVQTEFGLAHAAADVAAELKIPALHTVHTFYWASEGANAAVAPVIRYLLGRLTGTRLPRVALSDRASDNVLRNLTLSMAQRADVVISPSAHQARDLTAAGVTSEIRIVPNPIATSALPSEALAPEAAVRPSFLWVARCEAVKRPLVFAEAAVEALRRAPGTFSVDFVGEGVELPALRKLTAGISDIRVHGNLPHDQVLRLMDESAAVVLTSVGFDNQPMTIAEAVSRQRGVLYCDPKLQEGLGEAGFLAESPDAAGLADALVALSTAPEPLLALSEGAGRERTLFAPETFVAHLESIVQTAPERS
ncbi:glycosyltransferase family 4 protein [Salinibacterium hongtaonis]|uniref:glycosyltransferase family 4 protein n=1 Tax=Homoserinimonas hongtaonis TaxID=2079791 RepID=UPI000D3BCD9B|nr:glycosyltransferase family 4 protein [Salinibacterium hongtaonis]AWB89367.1 hypothetical protein C2138_07285 [Salinibacterium hongtaonis]